MAIRKNKKRIDPRYFMDEKTDIIKEAAYEPGPAVADIDTGEERMTDREATEEDVRDLAEKFNVEAFVETASDGKTAILVFHQNGEPAAYNNIDEMYQGLAGSY